MPPLSLVRIFVARNLILLTTRRVFFLLCFVGCLGYIYLHATAASEVSSILESRIAGSSLGGDVQETGRVLTIGDGAFARTLQLFGTAGDDVNEMCIT